jgi:hypothetical protein
LFGLYYNDERATFFDYVQAVDLGYCRPVTFHRHEGKIVAKDLEG